MRKQFLALVLALALLACLFAGCAKTETPTAQTPAPAEEPVAQPEAPAEEAPVAPAAPGEEAEEAPVEEAPVEEPPVEAAPPAIQYPLGDGSQTITYWKPFENFFEAFATEYSQFESVQAMEAATGVTVDFTSVSVGAATEQFQLMVASGDWPDMSTTNYYTGGAITAYNDDVILDLTDMIADAAPDMWAFTKDMDDDVYAGLYTDGMILGTLMIEHDNYQDEGNVTRADWLEEMGREVPQDFNGFIDLMYAIQDAYGTDYTYKMSTDGIMIGMQDVFDTEFATLSSSNGSLTMFRKDGQILNAGTTDGYRAYLEQLAQLYADRIINPEFFTQAIDRNTGMSITANGHVGVWADRANNAAEYAAFVDEANQGFRLAYLPIFTGDDGVNNYMNNPNRVSTSGDGGMAIYTSCEMPELVLNFLNYTFTQEGILLANYGVEGLSYTLDESGKPQYTDAVLNPAVGSTNEASRYYTWSLTGTYDDKSRLLGLYPQEVIDVINLWNDWSVMDWSADIPSAAALDADEQDSVNNEMADLNTIQVETVLRFITGDLELNDANWQDYLDTMEANGLSHVVGVYQTAYDDYLTDVTAMGR